MKLICESDFWEDYLLELNEMDFSHPIIAVKAAELFDKFHFF